MIKRISALVALVVISVVGLSPLASAADNDSRWKVDSSASRWK